MQKKAQTSPILIVGIVAIIAIVILGVIFQFIAQNALDLQTNSENITTTLNEITQLEFPNIVAASFTAENDTDRVTAANITLNAVGGTVNISHLWQSNAVQDMRFNYSYAPTGYITNGTTRIVISLIPVMLALAILIGVLVIAGVKKD